MTESCRAFGAQAILPQPVVTKRYKGLARDGGRGGGPVRHPLRHWLRSEATWQVLAGAQLTHPRTLAHRARCLGLKPHWAGRVRVWSWDELLQLAQPETERLVQLESQRRALHRRAGR